jgi:hypothetical protein
MGTDADTIYRVLTVYGADASKAKSELGGLAVVIDHVMNLAERAKDMIGGILELQSAAEGAHIAIAGLISASGFPGGNNFGTALKMSSEILQQMRRDAAALPGTFEDMQAIFQRAIPGGAQAGKSVQDIEHLSGRLMAVSKAFQIPAEFAGREFAEMMEGRASSRVALFAKLRQFMGADMDSSKFNALAAPEKWKAIEKALERFNPMIEEYAKTWDTISTTASSYLAQLMRIGSGSTFSGLKAALQSANDWYKRNQVAVDAWAASVGENLGAAFNFLADVIGAALPPAYEFFLGLWEVVKGVYGTLREVASAVADILAPAFGVAGNNARLLGEMVGALAVGFGVYKVAAMGVTMATEAWAAVQALLNGALAVNPIAATVALIAALAAGVLLVISYLDELVDSLQDMTDSQFTRGLLKKAGVIPQGATDEDIDESAFGPRGRARARAERERRMKETFGDTGIGAHVKGLLNDMGLARFGDNDAVSKGLNLPGSQDRIKQLVAQAGKPVEIHNTNMVVYMTNTIYESEDPGRVFSVINKAMADAVHRPVQSPSVGVYR